MRIIKFVFNLGMRSRLSYFSPIPKTPEYENLLRGGILKDEDPLTHNKIYFLYEKSNFSWEEFTVFLSSPR